MEQRKSAFPWVFQLFKKRKENRSTSDEGFASNTSSENEVNTTLVADKPGIDDFQIIRKIGKGGFGRVFLAKHTNQNKLVALKVIVKKEVPESKSDKEHVKAEHFVQTNMSHPFIAKLFCSFQTKSKIFYALEFLQGGELFSWMEKFERFSEKWAQFYLAEIFLAIEYLHENDIVYRDIKPENVMLDSKGHARLIDFGLCKIGVSEDDRTHTRTHCGTNSYMAPEILNKGQLYGPGVDWWSFGILAFDMMCGGPPWKGKDKCETFRQIMEDPPRIPRRLELNTQRFLKRLLTKDPSKRLGSPQLGGHKAIRDHNFFNDTDWFNTYLRKTSPPLFSYITRSIDSELDLAHFDNLPAKDDLESGKLYEDDDETDTDENDLEYNQLFKNFSYCDPDFI